MRHILAPRAIGAAGARQRFATDWCAWRWGDGLGRRSGDPDQFDLFEPPHEWREDGRGVYQQFLIAPPSELSAPAAHRGSLRPALASPEARGARD